MGYDFKTVRSQDRIYTVGELNRRARLLLEQQLGDLSVEAEVQQVTRARSGHLYFTLTDLKGQAQIQAVMWRGQALRYGAKIVTGQAVRCHGRVTLYEPRGSFQLVVNRAEEAGEGLKALKLAELKKKLAAQGVFDPAHKQPLPAFPECVGVVTSRSGAAIRDILKVLQRRYPLRIVLAHTQVQGAEAPAMIVGALAQMAERSDVDVVILGRGGGSTEDLDAFNTEAVVRAVFDHPQPLVAAVGHEIDTTLVDLAADHRAATPSEAAELVVPDRDELLAGLHRLDHHLARAVSHHLQAAKQQLAMSLSDLSATDPRVQLTRHAQRLAQLRESLNRWPGQTLPRARAELDTLRERIDRWPGQTLPPTKTALRDVSERIDRWPEPVLARARGEFAQLVASLEALSPLASLSRGYAVVRRRPDGLIVRDIDEAPAGTRVDITLARGELGCVVESSKDNDKQHTDP